MAGGRQPTYMVQVSALISTTAHLTPGPCASQVCVCALSTTDMSKVKLSHKVPRLPIWGECEQLSHTLV